eukprot:2319934-Lingulodinium_polyedra.AAC.1
MRQRGGQTHFARCLVNAGIVPGRREQPPKRLVHMDQHQHKRENESGAAPLELCQTPGLDVA